MCKITLFAVRLFVATLVSLCCQMLVDYLEGQISFTFHLQVKSLQIIILLKNRYLKQTGAILDQVCFLLRLFKNDRTSRIIYQNYNSYFKELLRKDSSLTTHQKNSKLLLTEMFKVKIGCAPDIIKEIFEIEK